MKIPVLFRQLQQVPAENAALQEALEHRSDLCCVRLGLPLPRRMRPFTGNLDSRLRIQEREYASIAEFTRLHMLWENDTECQALAEAWKHCYDFQRQELLYVDDPGGPVIAWIQMAAEQTETIRYTVNPNYTMPGRQASEGGAEK